MPKKFKYRKTFTFNGKRYTVYADDEMQLIRKLQEKLDALKRGEVIVSSSMLLDDWAEECIETYKVRQQKRTKYNYKNHYKNLIGKYIGKQRLKDIKPLDCQNVLNAASSKSQYEINQAYQIMNFLFNHAVENDLLPRSPAVGLIRPQGYREERRALTEAESNAAERIFCRTDKYRLFELMLYCGCRPAEAAGCMGKDLVDVDGYHCLHIRGTKTKNADRIVPVPDQLYARIRDTEPFQIIAPNRNGKPRSQTSRKRLWAQFSYDMNVEMGATEIDECYEAKDHKMRHHKALVGILPFQGLVPYNLRHTYCTRLMTQYNIDVRAAQYLMGHADIEMVAHYTHPDESVIKLAAEQMTGRHMHKDTLENTGR